MAITHFTPQLISRGDGRSVVAAAAYRHCARMENEREGRVLDFSNKPDLVHEEFVLPVDAPAWATTMVSGRPASSCSGLFWNKVEMSETRKDAQLAKEYILALPVELTTSQNIDLVRAFVATEISARGLIADWAYHGAPGNPHVHLMTNLRPLTQAGFGAKKVAVVDENGEPLRTAKGQIRYELWAGDKHDFLALRDAWLAAQNMHLTRAGHDVRVDGRSYAERGIDLKGAPHVGVAAKNIDRQAKAERREVLLERLALHEAVRRENAVKIARRPSVVIDAVSQEKSVFDQRDIAKYVHRYVDEPGQFQNLVAQIMASPELAMIEAEGVDFATGEVLLARYATREMIHLEAEMAKQAQQLAKDGRFGVRRAILREIFSDHRQLSDEQKLAIERITGQERLAMVVGRAGAGKTVMMKAARKIWEAEGFKVVGGALAGKAAEGLQTEAGIESRTLASWQLHWQRGGLHLDDKTVFVMDEAGMVASRQMAAFVSAVAEAGAKLVLVGDADQLQPIEAGGAFAALSRLTGYAELNTIYRQREVWMRVASMSLARGDLEAALLSYREHGHLIETKTKADAIDALLKDWVACYDPSRSSLILAYLKRDVRALNERARAALIEHGMLTVGHAFRTADGIRSFAIGDQVVFLKNESSLGVMNGMIGRVVEAEPGKISVEADGDGRGSGGFEKIYIDQQFYADIDHGYATTIHKSQGATVDRVKVLASSMFDRHLTYVAMTRHRESVELYASNDEFRHRVRADHRLGVTGKMVDAGTERFPNGDDIRPSPYVDLKDAAGVTHRLWGVDLPQAIDRADAAIGDTVTLRKEGTEQVVVKVCVLDESTGQKRLDQRVVDRNIWAAEKLNVAEQPGKPHGHGALQQQLSPTFQALVTHLSRSAAKGTTLHHTGSRFYGQAVAYANNRGLFGIRVAMALARNHARWIKEKRERLAIVATQLTRFIERIGSRRQVARISAAPNQPWLRGVSTWTQSIDQFVEVKLQGDLTLSAHWQELKERIKLVYQDPEEAMKAMRFAPALHRNDAPDRAELSRILGQLRGSPEDFGSLRGRTGWFASSAAKVERQRAVGNLPALCTAMKEYVRLRAEIGDLRTVEISRERDRQRIDVPTLSDGAQRVLERVRDAIDGNDIHSAIGFALADKQVKAEIDQLNQTLEAKFGQRAFLASREPKGPVYDAAAAKVVTADRAKLVDAWPDFRAAQQIAARERVQAHAQVRTQVRDPGITR